MIPCFSMRLEVEVPDPELNFFLINQDRIDGPKVIAPNWVNETRGDTRVGINHDDGPYSWGYWERFRYSYEGLIIEDRCGEDPIRTWGEVKEGDVCDDIIPIPDPDDARPGYVWVDVISDATEIIIERGFDVRQSVVGRPEVGTLKAQVLNPSLNALGAGTAQIGARVRMLAYDYDNETYYTIFTGVSNRIAVLDTADAEAEVQLFATDVVAQLNGVLVRNGREAETYKSRMEFAAGQVAGLTYTIQEGEPLTAIRKPLTALELLHTAQDSEGSLVFVDRLGHLVATDRNWVAYNQNSVRGGPKFSFTNNTSPDLLRKAAVDNEVICMSAWRQTNDTADVINGITFTNYKDEIDNPGEEDEVVVSKATNYAFTQDSSAKLYGSSSVRLTTYLDPVTLPDYADQVFDNFSAPRTKVEGIEFPADKFGDLSFPESILLDVGDEVRVVLKDPANDRHIMTDSTQRVAKIKHQITPQEWIVQAELL